MFIYWLDTFYFLLFLINHNPSAISHLGINNVYLSLSLRQEQICLLMIYRKRTFRHKWLQPLRSMHRYDDHKAKVNQSLQWLHNPAPCSVDTFWPWEYKTSYLVIAFKLKLVIDQIINTYILSLLIVETNSYITIYN